MHLGRRGIPGATLLLVLGLVLGAGGLAMAAVRPAPTRSLTTGTVPDQALRPNGDVDLEAMPDLISVTDDANRVVGYAYAEHIFKTAEAVAEHPELLDGVVEVFDKTGRTLVGHMHPNGAGFVPLNRAAGASGDEGPPPSRMTPTTVIIPPR